MTVTRFLTAAAACVFATSSFAFATNLVKDGKTSFVIVVANDAIPAEKTAAHELADYLKQVTGATLDIINESDLAGGEAPQILIGQTKLTRQLLPDLKWDSLQQDGIVMKTAGGKIILAGGRPRGTLYAVDTFLEDVAGVRWWTSTESTVPHKSTLDVADDLNVTYTPKLAYRESFNYDANRGGEHSVFASRLKLNGHHNTIPPELGGHYVIVGWCHTSFDLIPPGAYFKKHPEWFAQIGGKRQGGTQLCLSNPEMKKELIKNVLERVRKHPDAGIISVSQNDTTGPCECDACRAMVKEEGSQSGPWIRLVNEVAAEVNKEYPDYLVETLAYWYTRTPPKVTKPSKNVLVRLCSIECDFAHPLSGPQNKSFGDDLRGWSKITPRMFIWNYVTNFGNYLIPHPNMTSLGPDLQFFVDNNVYGVFEQGDAYNQLAGDFLPLRLWLQAKLMWDPSSDPVKLRDAFLNGYYGAAGPYLAQYLDVVNNVSKNPNIRVPCGDNNIAYLSDGMVEQMTKLFDDATKAVANDETLAKRVRRERLELDHVHLLRYDFTAAFKAHPNDAEAALAEYKRQARAWVDACREMGVKNQGEPTAFEAYANGFINRGRDQAPVKLPAAGVELPPGQFDIQEDRFYLYNVPQSAQLVDDAQASNGRASKMPGNRTDWATQFSIGKNAPFAGKGPWTAYLVIRSEQKKAEGVPFLYGLHDGPGGRIISLQRADMKRAADEKYHTYAISIDELRPGMYFWVAPANNGNVSSVYVDRIFIRKDAK